MQDHWSTSYVGLPWLEKGDTRAGVSCWGLCQIVYRDLAGIVLPSYGDRFACSAEQAEVQAIIRGATSGPAWAPVALEDARDLDVAVFAVAGLDAHVGLICGPGRMLHITHGQDSAIVDYRAGRWAHRLSGIYRHAEMMERARAA
ncbi:NlpC/P60 family protein [Methylobacterium isbiliense]|jgi:cell wall-associated NlpC family hydrolase|uniref:NlpC/P60 domain-containing protein n=1 Tax=Methylobacterium isbiliense TaxID=315478 RepID=A0ABQ4SBY2_9HYPH|nr:NlpC/P60 family protein [Methylobacterium isbiliense]MDN3622613.1 NlpC/P60 family protein [Methylobacterium isbiliense]GJE00539.1 hypothetical protein GMJLKIPL_2462 [Methylobacterium isbiliense]